MRMTKDQRANYRMLVAEAKGALKRLNEAVELYNDAIEDRFMHVEDTETEYEDTLVACEGFAATMMDEPTAEKSWRRFCFAYPDRREVGPLLGAEGSGPVDVFAMLEKKKK
jgi:hypothetical protein